MSKIDYNLNTGSEVTASIMQQIKESVNALYDGKTGKYVARLQGVSEDEITVTELFNELDITVSINRTAVGRFEIVLSNEEGPLPPFAKRAFSITQNSEFPIKTVTVEDINTVIALNTFEFNAEDPVGYIPADYVFFGQILQIEVFP